MGHREWYNHMYVWDTDKIEPTGGYQFVCECFFQTLRAYHLGPVRVYFLYTRLMQRLNEMQGVCIASFTRVTCVLGRGI